MTEFLRQPARGLSIALVHHPVRDRAGDTVTTAITNLDLHDISRIVRTYGLGALYAVHPVEAQRNLALRVREHWVDGSGRRRIPDRGEAMEKLRIVATLDDAIAAMENAHDARPELWTTAARRGTKAPTTFADAASRLQTAGPPALLLLGTGWGLADEVLDRADIHLEPVVGVDAYNHLSVRAACAIMVDRIVAGAR